MQSTRDQRGFTLIEVSIILLTLTILSTIMLPQMGNFNRLSRYVKAKEDLGAICSVMKAMLDQVMLGTFYGKPLERRVPVGLLAGPGAIPPKGLVSWSNWQREELTEFSEPTDYSGTRVEFVVDTFENHLQQNRPLGKWNDGDRYKNVFDNPMASGAFLGWRGPYMDAFTPDPWGNRYMANVFALHRPGDLPELRDGFTSAVVCYSTGPDLGADTAFNQPMNDRDGDGVYGWVTGADDLAVVFSAGGPF